MPDDKTKDSQSDSKSNKGSNAGKSGAVSREAKAALAALAALGGGKAAASSATPKPAAHQRKEIEGAGKRGERGKFTDSVASPKGGSAGKDTKDSASAELNLNKSPKTAASPGGTTAPGGAGGFPGAAAKPAVAGASTSAGAGSGIASAAANAGVAAATNATKAGANAAPAAGTAPAAGGNSPDAGGVDNPGVGDDAPRTGANPGTDGTAGDGSGDGTGAGNNSGGSGSGSNPSGTGAGNNSGGSGSGNNSGGSSSGSNSGGSSSGSNPSGTGDGSNPDAVTPRENGGDSAGGVKPPKGTPGQTDADYNTQRTQLEREAQADRNKQPSTGGTGGSSGGGSIAGGSAPEVGVSLAPPSEAPHSPSNVVSPPSPPGLGDLPPISQPHPLADIPGSNEPTPLKPPVPGDIPPIHPPRPMPPSAPASSSGSLFSNLLDVKGYADQMYGSYKMGQLAGTFLGRKIFELKDTLAERKAAAEEFKKTAAYDKWAKIVRSEDTKRPRAALVTSVQKMNQHLYRMYPCARAFDELEQRIKAGENVADKLDRYDAILKDLHEAILEPQVEGGAPGATNLLEGAVKKFLDQYKDCRANPLNGKLPPYRALGYTAPGVYGSVEAFQLLLAELKKVTSIFNINRARYAAKPSDPQIIREVANVHKLLKGVTERASEVRFELYLFCLQVYPGSGVWQKIEHHFNHVLNTLNQSTTGLAALQMTIRGGPRLAFPIGDADLSVQLSVCNMTNYTEAQLLDVSPDTFSPWSRIFSYFKRVYSEFESPSDYFSAINVFYAEVDELLSSGSLQADRQSIVEVLSRSSYPDLRKLAVEIGAKIKEEAPAYDTLGAFTLPPQRGHSLTGEAAPSFSGSSTDLTSPAPPFSPYAPSALPMHHGLDLKGLFHHFKTIYAQGKSVQAASQLEGAQFNSALETQLAQDIKKTTAAIKHEAEAILAALDNPHGDYKQASARAAEAIQLLDDVMELTHPGLRGTGTTGLTH
jgi:hypothetical protein